MDVDETPLVAVLDDGSTIGEVEGVVKLRGNNDVAVTVYETPAAVLLHVEVVLPCHRKSMMAAVAAWWNRWVASGPCAVA